MKIQILICLILINSAKLCFSQKAHAVSLETISAYDIPPTLPGQDEPEASLFSEEEKEALIKSLFQEMLYTKYQTNILKRNYFDCIRNNNLEEEEEEEEYLKCFDQARIITRASLISALKQKPK